MLSASRPLLRTVYFHHFCTTGNVSSSISELPSRVSGGEITTALVTRPVSSSAWHLCGRRGLPGTKVHRHGGGLDSHRIAVRNALFLGRKRMSSLTVPWCTYTDPEIAHVGIYVRQARERNLPVKTQYCSFR